MRRDPLIDTLAGNYRLVERLGAGGMGEVYKGVHKDIGSKVAIKLLHAMAARDKNLQERFLLEAKAVNRIEHPGVVKVVDAGRTEGGRPFLVMELLDGHSLHELKKAKRLSIAQACRAMVDVLDALAAAHAAGVVHRDLKPANLFRTRDGRTVVLDFGVAKLMSSDASVRLTATGSAIGTPHYMAPEQIRGKPVTPAVDIYAVGVVLFELVCGRRPFDHDDEDGVLAGHLERRPPPPRALEPAVPVAVQDVILAALQKEPERRPASAAAMRDALRAAIAAEPAAAAEDGPSPWARPGKPSAPPRLPATPDSSNLPTVPARIPRTEPQATPSGVRAHRARTSRTKMLVLAGAAAFSIVGVVLVVYAATRSRDDITASTRPAPDVQPIAVAPDATGALDAAPSLPFTGDLPANCAQLVTVDPIGVADERHAEVKATFFRRCEEDLWSTQTISCFVGATTIPDFADCVAALSPTQRDRLQAALDAPRGAKKHLAKVTIDSTPQGALVYDGNKLLGRTPLVIKTVPHQLEIDLALADYETKRISIDARTNRENVVRAVLKRRPDNPFEKIR